MKRSGAVLIVGALAVIGLAAPAAAKNDGQRNFAAPLSGGQEVPAVDTQATVNVHTIPPGVPSGEVRGQIK